MIAAVKDAKVLIVNPTHLSTALRYDAAEDEAPTVVAHGEGDLAQRLIQAAHQYNVPVVRDVPVAHALRELALGEQIPEALYEAVAEVLRELLEPEEATTRPSPDA
jgi:flagellar biosynthesis protein FlhB